MVLVLLVLRLKKSEVIIDGKIKQYSYLKENKDIKTVRLIFNNFIQLGSSRYVTQYLANNGIKTVNNKFFYDKSVKAILRNPVYCTADKDSFDYFKQKNSDICFNKTDFHKNLGIMAFNRHNLQYENKFNQKSKWVIALEKHERIISGKD